MIKKLRHKFIGISMLSIFLVLFLIVCSINIINYVEFNRGIDNIINVLGENNGRFPPTSDDSSIDKEDPYSTRYFTVTLNDSGVLSINTSQIVTISDKEAETMALKLYKSKSYSGFSNGFKYKSFKQEYGADFYIFVDCERYITTLYNFFNSSILISVIGLTMVFILVYLFSIIVFKPIAESYQKQKLFITNASHELKTPLAVISANNEILEMANGENEWTKSTSKQIAGMNELISRLITLAKIDENKKEDFRVIDISNILNDVKKPFKSIEVTLNKPIKVTIENGLLMSGNEKNIRELFSVLIENSLKYALPHKPITISLKKKNKKTIEFKLENETNNFKEGNLNYLFERFYRNDNDSTQAGFGIGLSIAKAIVTNHKGKINAECIDDNKIIFTITLPSLSKN